MMESLSILEAVFLGAVQGATEFLPVSSSGHLVIAQQLLGVNLEGGAMLAFDVCLHFGTLLAVVAVFWRDIGSILEALLRWRSSEGHSDVTSKPDGGLTTADARRLGLYLIIGTIPAVVFGLAFKKFFEALFSDALAAALMLLVTGGILWGTRFAKGRDISVSRMGWQRALGVGLAQAVAIIPGISRSGSTIAGGLYLGLDRALAARFAFLLAVPAIGGAGLLELTELSSLSGDILIAVAIGMAVSAAVGFICVKWMLRIVQRGRLSWFAYYCWAAGLATIAYLKIESAM